MAEHQSLKFRPPGTNAKVKAPGVGVTIYGAVVNDCDIKTLDGLLEKWAGNEAILNWRNPENGSSALIMACVKNHVECLSSLVKTSGVDVNLADNDGCTALFIAAYFGRPELVKLLLTMDGIDIDKAPTSNNKGHIGKTPLMMAQEKAASSGKEKYKEVVRLLENAPKLKRSWPAWWQQVAFPYIDGSTRKLLDKIEDGSPRSSVSPRRPSPRMSPRTLPAPPSPGKLVEPPPLTQSSDPSPRQSPRTLPAPPSPRKLVEPPPLTQSSDPSPRQSPRTPSTQPSFEELVEPLPRLMQSYEPSPLPLLNPIQEVEQSQYVHPDPPVPSPAQPPTVSLITRQPGPYAGIVARQGTGETIYEAAKEGNVSLLTILLDRWSGNKAVLNWNKNKNHFTPFFIACANGHVNCVEELLSTSGVDVNEGEINKGYTGLFIAVLYGRVDVVRLLLTVHELDINLAPFWGKEKGMSPLNIARKIAETNGDDGQEIVRLLEEAGARDTEPKSGGKNTHKKRAKKERNGRSRKRKSHNKKKN